MKILQIIQNSTYASEKGYKEIVKILPEQKGIDINAKSVLLFLLIYIFIILDFKKIFGISSKYLQQQFYMQWWIVTQKN